MSGNMKVVVRLRPLSQKETSSGAQRCCEPLDEQHLAILRKAGGAASAAGSAAASAAPLPSYPPTAYLKSQTTDSLNEFAFDRVFGSQSTQDEVYQETVQPFLSPLLAGQHLTVFAYGATGAGKTHTMFGSTLSSGDVGAIVSRINNNIISNSTMNAGVIPQCLVELVALVDQRRLCCALGEAWSISLSFFEVYNDQVYDLIESTGKNLPVREDADKGIVQISGLKELVVESPEQIIEYLIKGQKCRKMEPTMANVVSSRSHAVFQVIIKHITRNSHGFESMIESKLSLIDLAGSERASATNNRGVRLQEGANINKSLLALANCINALSENSQGGSQKKIPVKYRDSKLTHILKTSLEGNCNLVMITNINPSDQTYEDSLHTLHYANRAKNIKVNPIARELILESTSLEREARLREENDNLRETLTFLQQQVKSLQEANQNLNFELTAAVEANARRITFGFGRTSSGRKKSTGSDERRNSHGSPKRSLEDRKMASSPPESRRSSFGIASVMGALSPISLASATAGYSPKSNSTPESVESHSKTELEPTGEDISLITINLDEETLAVEKKVESPLPKPERLSSVDHQRDGRRRRGGIFTLFMCGANDAVVQ